MIYLSPHSVLTLEPFFLTQPLKSSSDLPWYIDQFTHPTPYSSSSSTNKTKKKTLKVRRDLQMYFYLYPFSLRFSTDESKLHQLCLTDSLLSINRSYVYPRTGRPIYLLITKLFTGNLVQEMTFLLITIITQHALSHLLYKYSFRKSSTGHPIIRPSFKYKYSTLLEPLRRSFSLNPKSSFERGREGVERRETERGHTHTHHTSNNSEIHKISIVLKG